MVLSRRFSQDALGLERQMRVAIPRKGFGPRSFLQIWAPKQPLAGLPRGFVRCPHYRLGDIGVNRSRTALSMPNPSDTPIMLASRKGPGISVSEEGNRG